MKNKTIKIILIIYILISILLILPQTSLAGGTFSGGGNFINAANTTPPINTSNIASVSDTIYNILLALGIAATVIVGAILGIQFMTGGIEGQAKVKESLLPFGIGCIIIYGAFGIWKIFAEIVQNI